MLGVPAEISHRYLQDRQDWFDKRRDRFIRQVYDDFFSILGSFQDLYGMYVSCHGTGSGSCSDLLDRVNEELRNRIWDRLTEMVGNEVEKGPLWQLKDLCHRIWPEDTAPWNVEGSLVDWLIGTIFHETMKLKENIYILNSYGPAAFRISAPGGDDRAGSGRMEVAAPRLDRIMDIKGLIGRIVSDVSSQMEQLAFLFGQANCMLRIMTHALSGNILVIRLLVEEEQLVRELWGEEVISVFADMFYGAPEQGFCAAGRSYLAGQWYQEAQTMYQRAVDINPGCDEAIVKLFQLTAVLRQNRELLRGA